MISDQIYLDDEYDIIDKISNKQSSTSSINKNSRRNNNANNNNTNNNTINNMMNINQLIMDSPENRRMNTRNKLYSGDSSSIQLGMTDSEQSSELYRLQKSGRVHSNDVTINTAHFHQLILNNSQNNNYNNNNNYNTSNNNNNTIQNNNYSYNNNNNNTQNINNTSRRDYLNQDEDIESIENQQPIIQESKSNLKSEVFTRINEITINHEGADRRRKLLNHVDEDLGNIRTKRESILDTSNTYEEAKKLPIQQYSVESLFNKFRAESTTNNNNNPTIIRGRLNNNTLSNNNDNLYTSNSNHMNLNISQARTNAILHSPEQQMILLNKQIGINDTHYNINSGLQSDQGLQYNNKIKVSELNKSDDRRQTMQQLKQPLTPSINIDRVPSSHLSQQRIEEENTMIRPVTLIYLRRFINQLKKSIFSSLYRNLKINQIKLINDKSYYIDENNFDGLNTNKNNKNKNQYYKIKKQIKDRFSKMKGVGFIYENYLKDIVISSQSNFFMLFQTLLLFSLLVQIYIIPIRICFDFDSNISQPFNLITLFTIPIFCIEILLNCITSYYEEGLEVRKQKKIIKKYIKNQFLIDVITFCTLIVSLHTKSNQFYLSIIFLVRLKRIPTLINSIDDHFQLEHRFPSSFELLKLLLLIATIGHYCGCGFNYLGQLELRNNEYNWLQYKKIENKDWSIQYLSGLYFSFITMITVGYGDITPQTNKEIIYVLFMTLISCGTFGYSINTIGSIFREMQIRKSELKSISDVSPYTKKKGIEQKLHQKLVILQPRIEKNINIF